MFHAVSKLLFVFSTPIFWIGALLLAAIFVKNAGLKKKLLIAAFATFYLFSNSFLFDEIVGPWEPKMNEVDPNKKYDCVVVLGGYSVYAPRVKQINLSESADRLTNTLPLYHSGQVNKIILAGGPGNLYDFNEPEAIYAANYLESVGVKRKDIITEPDSRNTHQNAVNAKKLIDSLNIKEPILLVTSTTHMPRSSACFEKQGIAHDQYRVDGLVGERKFYFDHLFIPNAFVLLKWNVIIHEWLGLISYKIAGYID